MSDTRDVARCWAGFASLGAGLVHLAVVQEHFHESALFGIFFVVSGVLQIGWAVVALARDRMPLPRLAAATQLAMVALWAVTRTVGLPVGPRSGLPRQWAAPTCSASCSRSCRRARSWPGWR